ncbi:MAG: hypothetical protein FWG50_14330 [Kiritimatiellaeota bacterium]|nr:hypothetical protein [Kiritimatiellota bacterium]
MITLTAQERERIAEYCQRLNVRRMDVFGLAAFGDIAPAKCGFDFQTG